APEHLEQLRGVGLRGLLIVPLQARGRILGALSVLATSRRRYRAGDLELARALANRAALALDNARLYHAAQAAVQAKDETLALLNPLLPAAPVGLAFVDCRLRTVRMNEALAAILGVQPEAAAGRSLAELSPDLAPRIEPFCRRVLETREP